MIESSLSSSVFSSLPWERVANYLVLCSSASRVSLVACKFTSHPHGMAVYLISQANPLPGVLDVLSKRSLAQVGFPPK